MTLKALLTYRVVVAETVVGATTGCVPAPKGYFKAMKSVCEKYGALFILDEVSNFFCHTEELTKPVYFQVMSGMGREQFSISMTIENLPK